MLRDDIETLLKKYIEFLERKQKLLNDISLKDIENRFLTEASDTDGLEKNLEYIANIIDEISILDYELSLTKGKISLKTGTPVHELRDLFTTVNHRLASGIPPLEKDIAESIEKFIRSRDRLIKLMEENINSLAENIKGLSRLRKFDLEKIKKTITR